MKTLTFTEPPRHRGGMLIEALVGLLIMGIVGGGMVHVTARVSVTQQQMAVQDIVVREMRDLLMRHGSGTLDLCSGGQAITVSEDLELDVAVQGCAAVNATITVDGAPVVLSGVRQPLVLSVESEALGLIRVGGQTDA